jgi:hypothetical protein
MKKQCPQGMLTKEIIVSACAEASGYTKDKDREFLVQTIEEFGYEKIERSIRLAMQGDMDGGGKIIQEFGSYMTKKHKEGR